MNERKPEKRGDPFAREELTALLRMFSSLGLVVTGCIVGFFLLGLHVARRATAMGWGGAGALRVIFLLAGVALGVYWAYLRILRHLDTYERRTRPEDEK